MRKAKKNYLRINDKPYLSLSRLGIKSEFIHELILKKLPLGPKSFVILSALSGLIVFMTYKMSVGSNIYAITAGILSLSLPYLCIKAPSMMKAKVDEALSYKNFINILKSSLRATNSVKEAIEMTAKEDDLSSDIKVVMQKIVSDMKLGDTIEDALDKAIDSVGNVHFKMALTIIRINHSVGSKTSIDALNNILKSMDSTISNIELLKDKINTAVSEKMLFLGIILAVPLVHSILPKEVIMTFYSDWAWESVMSLMLVYAYAGQFIMDHMAEKAIRKV